MATTVLNTASYVQKWDSTFLTAYVRDTRFSPYMGAAKSDKAMMPILLNRELTTGGKTVNMPFIAPLAGDGKQGREGLVGNEEALANYNQAITVNYNRHAVEVSRDDEAWTEMNLRDAARMSLKQWASRWLNWDIISAMLDVNGTSFINGRDAQTLATAARKPLAVYTALTETAKDAWLAANADRVLFGAAKGNNASNDHSAALLECDATNDRMTTSIISLAKQLAKETANGSRGINPFKVEADAGRENYVLFAGPRAFRDLKKDTAMVQANRDARIRGTSDNPIFQDGDLLWDGVIIREIPEIPVLAGVGNTSADVEPYFLCGAGAVGVAWGQYPQSRVKKEDDYGFKYGVAIEENRGVTKHIWNGVQHGMVTGYVAAPPTA